MAKQYFGTSNGYMVTQPWLWANVIQYFTLGLCRRLLNQSNDPQGRLFDQMTMAARSVTANIAEGLSRADTSKETELKLLDVARASISELSNDLFFQCICQEIPIWNKANPNYDRARCLQIAVPRYGDCWLHDSQQVILMHIDGMRQWLANDSLEIALNTMLIVCERLKLMLMAMINQKYEQFLLTGGFREHLSQARIEARRNPQANPEAPLCPICKTPMVVRICETGQNHGKLFWGCPNWAVCHCPPIFDPKLQRK